MLDGTPKTVGMAVPKHCGKLYQLWETVTVLTFHLLYKLAAFTRIDLVFFSQVNPCKAAWAIDSEDLETAVGGKFV